MRLFLVFADFHKRARQNRLTNSIGMVLGEIAIDGVNRFGYIALVDGQEPNPNFPIHLAAVNIERKGMLPGDWYLGDASNLPLRSV